MGERERKVTVDPCVRHRVVLLDGRTVEFFVNVETGLVVVDVIDVDEQGGVELVRKVVL